MSVNSYLTDLASNLVLTSSETSSISTSIVTLKSRLTSYFGSDAKEQLQFGSSVRGTILPRKADAESDVDYMVVFDTSAGKKKPDTYIERLRRFANSHYSTSEIYRSHPTVVLSLGHINFELVPAVYEYGYMIPSPPASYQDWIYTSPTKANDDVQQKNKDNDSFIKPLIRLVKYWNAKNGYPYYSFGLEQRIINQWYFNCSALKDYFYTFWSNFNYDYGTAQWIKDKVDLAKKRSEVAKNYEAQGYGTLAEDEVKKIVPPL